MNPDLSKIMKPSKNPPSNTTQAIGPDVESAVDSNDSAINVTGYDRDQVRQCAGYIIVHPYKGSSWWAQVCAVAAFPSGENFTLLLLTSRHVVTVDKPRKRGKKTRRKRKTYNIYKQDGDKFRLKDRYRMRIRLPANDDWHWDSQNGVDIEIFVGNKRSHDIALIAIKLKPGVLPPYPTMLPDINNEVAEGKNRAKFYGIVFRPKKDKDIYDDGKEFKRCVMKFRATSALSKCGLLKFKETAIQGDSGGMVYCYASDHNKLVPVCIITRGRKGKDICEVYNNNNKRRALKEVWSSTMKTLDKRESEKRWKQPS